MRYCLLGLIILLVGKFNLQASEARDGIILLSKQELASKGSVKLEGKWDFYWTKLYTPNDFSKGELPPDAHIQVPGTWTGMLIHGKAIENLGYATFRLKIIADTTFPAAIFFKEIISANCIWLNGKIIAQAGKVSSNKNLAIPQYKLNTNFIVLQKGENELVVQVSNYDHRANGFEYAPVLGKMDNVSMLEVKNYAIELIVIGFLLMLAFYHLGIFLFPIKNVPAIIFSVFCFLAIVRVSVTSNNIISLILPDIDWHVIYFLKYFTLYTIIPLLGLLLQKTFDEKKYKKAFLGLYLISGIFIFSLVLPSRIYTQLLIYYEVIALSYFILVLGSLLIRYAIKKEDGAFILLSSVTVLALTTMNDMFYYMDILHTREMVPIGILILVLGQALTLGKRFTSLFLKNQQISAQLDFQNQNLKTIVNERTEQLETEKLKLRDSNLELKKFHTAIEQSHATIVITNIHGDIEYVNPQFEKTTGYRSEEVTGKNPRILKSPQNSSEEYQNLWKTILNGEVWQGEFINLTKDQREYIERAIISPVKNENNDITHFIAIKEDITHLKMVEKSLRESERKYRLITENTTDVIWKIDIKALKYTYISPSVFLIRGYTPEEVMVAPLGASLTPESLQECLNELSIALESSKIQKNYGIRKRFQQPCKDGKIIDIEMTASLLYNELGEPEEIIGVSRDITEQVKMEKSLAISEEKYRLISESTSDVILKINIESLKYSYVSPSVKMQRGFSVEEVMKETFKNTLMPESYESAIADLMDGIQISKVDKSYHMRKRYKQPCKDGRIIDIEIEANFLFDEVGNPIEMIGVTRDITEQVLIEKALASSEAKLVKLLENQTDKNKKLAEQLDSIYNHSFSAIGFLLVEDQQIRFLTCNHLWAHELGYTTKELEDGNIEDFCDNSTVDLYKELIFRTLDKKGPLYEYVKWREKYLYICIVPIYDDFTNNLKYCACFTYNVTDEFKAEIKMHESEEKFRTIFHSSRDAILLLDLNLNVIDTNYGTQLLLGENPEKSKPVLSKYVPEEYHPELMHRLELIKQKETIFSNEYQIIRNDGTLIPVEFNTTLVTINKEKMLLCMLRDISVRKNLERNLTQITLQTENRERRKLAADLHDNVGPLLSSMNMGLSLITRRQEIQPLLDDFNDIRKVLKEAIAAVREISNNISPQVLINYGVISALEVFFETKKKLITLQFENNIGEMRFNEVHETMLFYIIKEAFNNSLKYAQAKNIHVNIEKTGNKIHVLYQDNGIGFNLEEKLAKVSTSLGLFSIIYRVKNLDGDYSIETSPGQGFKLNIIFPLNDK